MQVFGYMAGAAQLEGGGHGEAAGMRHGDQFLWVGPLAVTEAGVEAIGRIFQCTALSGETAFAVLAAAVPGG